MGFRTNVTVVCHQLRSPDNLGALARLCANFGLSRLVLSDPATHDFREAEKLAIGAEHVLKDMAVARDLREAVGPSVFALGTTSRAQLRGRSALEPEEAARRLAEHARRGKVSLVFGGEKRGLSDEDLAFCQDVAVIPTDPVQPSMNISHAAAVMFYLVARQEVPVADGGEAPGARLETIHALEELLEKVLGKSGWLNPQAPQHARRELVRSLTRAKLSQREAEMWLSALQHADRQLR